MPTLGTPEVAIELGTTSSDEVEEKGYRTSGESTDSPREFLLEPTCTNSHRPSHQFHLLTQLRTLTKLPRTKPLIMLALALLALFLLLLLLRPAYPSNPTPLLPLSSPPSSYIPSPSSSGLDPNLLAIMIEKRDQPTLIPILISFLEKVPEHWGFQVWYGSENRGKLLGDEGLRKWRDSGRLKLVRFPEEFIELNSGDQLSRFLTRPWFWEQLAPAEHIFFFQSDSVICGKSNKTLDDFLGYDKYEGGYDWVGAPWGWRGYPTIPWGGNGGFSLRRRSRMLDLTERFTEDWERERPAEDYWFAHKLEETTTAFPETDFAMSFAFESPPLAVIDEEWIYEPYGVHIGGGMAWGLCPGRAPGWGSEQVRRLLKWCPEALPIIPEACLP